MPNIQQPYISKDCDAEEHDDCMDEDCECQCHNDDEDIA